MHGQVAAPTLQGYVPVGLMPNFSCHKEGYRGGLRYDLREKPSSLSVGCILYFVNLHLEEFNLLCLNSAYIAFNYVHVYNLSYKFVNLYNFNYVSSCIFLKIFSQTHKET